MTMKLEFVVDRRPVSSRARSRGQWKRYIAEKALERWNRPPIRESRLSCTIVYLCSELPMDTDNMVKPILDSLTGIVFEDDALVDDVLAHRRFLDTPFDLERLPADLVELVVSSTEGVYIRIEESPPLERVIQG